MKWFSIVAWMLLLACAPGAFASHRSHRKTTSHKSNVKHSRHTKKPRRSKHSQNVEDQPSIRAASFHPAALAEADVQSSRSSTKSTKTTQTTKSKTGARKRSRRKTTARRAPVQMIPTPERISEIQSALSRGGYYTGDPTGKIDANTVDALQHFQSANGLDSTGKLDALTLQKLGLGSDVAGVSAPKGIVSHSCCSITPSPSLAPAVSPAGTAPSPADSSKPKPSSATDSASANSSALNSAAR